MKHGPVLSGKRRTIQMSLPEEHVADAEALGIDLDQLASDAIAIGIRRERERRWADEHRERMDAFAAWLDEHGMPFEDLRVF